MKSKKLASMAAVFMIVAVMAVPGFAHTTYPTPEVSTGVEAETVGEQTSGVNLEDEVVTETELSIIEQEYATTSDPESFVYPFKRLGEFFQDLFTFDPDAKAKLRIQFAKERLAEAKLMAEKGKGDRAVELIREYEANIEGVETRIREKIKIGSDVSQIARETRESTAKSALVLALVKEKLPEQAKSAIERAIRNSLEKKARAEVAEDIEEAQKGKPAEADVQAKLTARYEQRLAALLEKHEARIKSLEERFAERLERRLQQLEVQIAQAEEAGRTEQIEALERIKTETKERFERKVESLEEMRERIRARITTRTGPAPTETAVEVETGEPPVESGEEGVTSGSEVSESSGSGSSSSGSYESGRPGSGG